MGRRIKEPVSYVFYYRNGTSKVHHFENRIHYEFFLHDEGDQVVDTKRFFPDEQNEEDYVSSA